MAERTIGLRIELNGFKGVITNIKQLEDELRKAKEDLNELEIGGTMFKQLSGEIQRAEGKLIGLRKSSEGLGLEKQLEGYGKLAAGITSGFAAAQAAVNLFGAESENVAKAAATAQNLLTLALSARAIEETIVGINTVKTTIATKAATAATALEAGATNILTVSLRALFTTIAANPMGALLTVLGLAAAAMMAFANDTEKAEESYNGMTSTMERQAKVLDSTSKQYKENQTKLKALIPVIFDVTKNEKVRNEALKETAKIIPSLNGLTISQAGALNKVTAALTAYNAVQEQTLNTQFAYQNLMTIQARLNEIHIEQIKATTEFVYSQDKEVHDAAKARIKLLKQEKDFLEYDLKGATKGYQTEQVKLLEVQAKYGSLLEDNSKVKTNDVKLTDAQTKAGKNLEGELTKTEQAYQKILDTLKKTIEIQKIEIGEPKIIETLNKILDARKGLQDPSLEEAFKTIGLDITNGLNNATDAVDNTNDAFLELFDTLIKIDEQGLVGFNDELSVTSLRFDLLTQTVEEFGVSVNKIVESAASKLKEGLIDKAQFDVIKGVTDQYAALNKLINQLPSDKAAEFRKNIELLLTTQRDLNISTGKFSEYITNADGEIVKITESSISYTDSLLAQKKVVEDLTKNVTDYYTKQFDATNKEFKTNVDKQVKLGKITKDQANEILANRTENAEKIKKIIADIATAEVEGLVTISTTIQEEETKVNEFIIKAQALRTQNRALETESIKNTLLNNLGLVYDYTQKENAIRIDEKAKQSVQLAKLEKDLMAKGIDITKMTEKEKLKILKEYLDKQVEATKEAEDKKKAEQKLTIEDVQKALEVLSSSLASIASIAAQNTALQLDMLEYNYESTLANVVGDTKEADIKRLELEKEYQAQKRKIEKEGQIAALKFTLAQSIANAAAAIVNIWATTPNPIAAGILTAISAGISLAQIAIISEQLSFAQSTMRRGGVMASGGLVSGPSHEQGGIYMGGGYTLEGNEAVINRQSTLQYGALLSQINQSNGGRPITIQSAMDSRLIEALAKQNTTPIRAYVVEQDITRAQTINKRLEQLASF